MLELLLCHNAEGVLRSHGRRGGFVDARSGRAQRLCGVGTFLHERCAGFPKLTRAQYRARREKRHRRGDGRASSKRVGEYCHRQLAHQLCCVANGRRRCLCPQAAPSGAPRRDSLSHAMVEAARDFAASERLRFEAVEQVVADANVGVATRFDALARREGTSPRFVLVSWKTSSACPFDDSVRSASLDEWLSSGSVSSSSSSEAIAAREHLAQLTVELHLLRDSHAIDVAEACVVYLSPGERRFRVVWLTRESIDGGGYARCFRRMLATKQ